MTRIRYRKVCPDVFDSIQRFHHKTNGGKYFIRLNLQQLQWLILDIEERVVVSGHSKNARYLKMHSRDALAELGIDLTLEERAKRKV